MVHVITGATGLLGSHIAVQLSQQGEKVRALVRPSSDTRFLRSLGVELVEGDLANPVSLRQGMREANIVYHAAAKVGDWGSRAEYRRDIVEGTRNVLDACAAQHVQRLIHISSIGVYGHPRGRKGPITESDPLGSKLWIWDNYLKAKLEAENLVWDCYRRTGCHVTVIRPSVIYGPRDRIAIFRLTDSLKAGRMRILGKGDNQLSMVYAGNVAEACIIAARKEEAVGQAYNISNDGVITQKEFIKLFADNLGVPCPERKIPFRVAFFAAFLMEAVYHLLKIHKPPFVTRYATWLLGRNTVYSSEKAEKDLGWKPRIGYSEAIRKTVEWYRSQLSHGSRYVVQSQSSKA